jgi:phage terminase large subunit GpA-like protein
MEREQFVGWDCETEEEAQSNGKWICPLCGKEITDKQRISVNSNAILVHKGQDVDPKGNIVGPMPPTRSLGFRWGAYHNLFTDSKVLASDEWNAKHAANVDEAEKAIRQTVWCLPYTPNIIGDEKLDANVVMKRTEKIGHREIPADTQHLAIGVDIGDWHSWFLLLCFRANGQIHIPDYGVIEVHSDSLERKVAVLAALREFRDTVMAGWPMQGSPKNRTPDAVWIDAGHYPAVIHQFCKESGTFPTGPWLSTLGRGSSQMHKMRYTAPKRTGNEIRKIGEKWFIAKSMEHHSFQATFDADYWKIAVQNGLRIPMYDEEANPSPGAITLFDPGSDKMVVKRHTTLAKHFASEQIVQRMEEGKGLVTEWTQHGANHWLDATANALAAGNYLGWSIVQTNAVDNAPTVNDWVAKR